jgi:hypothetical protein
MPIRFRCKYCNQLIGIARRKAGSDVSCPTCHGRLTVPAGDRPGADGDPTSPPGLFEGNDFDDYLRSPFTEEASRHAAASRSRGVRPLAPASPDIDVERLPVGVLPAKAPAARGIVLTPFRLTVLSVAAVLLLAAAFAAGVGVDRWLLAAPAP